MLHERRVSPLAIDLNLLSRRSVTSLYSNLVTRPTGRAIRMGVESQIAELDAERYVCLSVLDFSQVRVLDYSCADEIVAKLLLRYAGEGRPAEAFFLVRGLQEQHEDAVEAVLERHRLLLVSEGEPGQYGLLGPRSAEAQACWNALLRRGRASVVQIAVDAGIPVAVAGDVLTDLTTRRVVVPVGPGAVCALPALVSG